MRPWLSSTTRSMARTDPDRPATTMVTLVKTSPALVPKALDPPTPPKAPASPPPLPALDQDEADQEERDQDEQE